MRSAKDFARHLQVGSCALVAWMKKNVVHIANAGDSSAYFFSDDGTQTKRLNVLHNIALASEQEAMKSREEFKHMNAADLFTCKAGRCRVRGRLQVTRALGDLYMDNYIRRIPQISSFEFDKSGYVVLGSDGFWDEFPTRNTIDQVRQTLQSEAVKQMSMAQKAKALVHLGYRAAGRRTQRSAEELELVMLGYDRRKLVDDMTVLVMRVEQEAS
jgi:serine/threonine protein phosphatase PrpC